jgi:hypothetical protein
MLGHQRLSHRLVVFTTGNVSTHVLQSVQVAEVSHELRPARKPVLARNDELCVSQS